MMVGDASVALTIKDGLATLQIRVLIMRRLLLAMLLVVVPAHGHAQVTTLAVGVRRPVVVMIGDGEEVLDLTVRIGQVLIVRPPLGAFRWDLFVSEADAKRIRVLGPRAVRRPFMLVGSSPGTARLEFAGPAGSKLTLNVEVK